MYFTLDKTTTLGLSAYVRYQHYCFQQYVVLGYSIHHCFLQKINEFLISKQYVSPIFVEFASSHNAYYLQAKIRFFGLSHHTFHQFVPHTRFHAHMQLLRLARSKHIFAKFKQRRVLYFNSFIEYFKELLRSQVLYVSSIRGQIDS